MTDPADQRLFIVDDEVAVAFKELLERPGRHLPRLAALLADDDTDDD